MGSMNTRTTLTTAAALLFSTVILPGAETPGAAQWSWQQPHAKVDPKGDLAWRPRPFGFEKGDSVRYVDFDGGKDADDGRSPETPWKHHPWDARATGAAKACSGIHTYVFKRGSTYRGTLVVRDAGRPGNPIRLTSDPEWGTGAAVLCGSDRVTGWKQGADRDDIPAPEKVRRADIDFAPRCVWTVDGNGTITRLPLARTPNWTVSNPDDVKAEWWTWDNPRKPFGNTVKNARGRAVHLGIDTKHITGKPADYFKGALIWPEFGWVMSTPYPTRVEVVDLNRRGLGFSGWTGGGTGGVIMRGMRYYLEDKPHYLDDPAGEYWFDKKGAGGRLYVRLPGGADPDTTRVEAGRRLNLVDGKKVAHLHVTGLTFRFTTPAWNITAPPWDFSTKPWGLRPEIHPACVRVWGEGQDIRVANCRFEHVYFPLRIRSLAAGQRVDGVVIADNDFRYTDAGILSVADGSGWGYAKLRGRLGAVRILRNHALETGRRPPRYGNGEGMAVGRPRTLDIAGNVIERSYAQGIDIHGGKVSGSWGDVPFTRILIHHNTVRESMLNCNDFGGIETWQGGPFYVFNNISYNALGYRNWQRYTGKDPGFGHAYYLDGAFKNYHFNNIARGKSKQPGSPVVNCAAFQEIHSYQNTFFHNTVFNYYVGSRRQAPSAGRNKYLANVWTSLGRRVFRHADPAKTAKEGNAKHAGPPKNHYALETNAYGRNVFHDFPELGVFEPAGRWLKTVDDFRAALEDGGALLAELGVFTEKSPLRDAAKGDFRPADDSAARDRGARVFVPWALSGVVGEWHFYPAGDDPARIVDEHWYLTDYHVSREHYHARPLYPLRGVNITKQDYVRGPLEDWIAGALRFVPAKKQYAIISNEEMMKPFSFRARRKSRHEGGKPEPCTVAGAALKNPQVYTSNLLIEAHVTIAPGHTGGVLMEKKNRGGYSLAVGDTGTLAFTVGDGKINATVRSKAAVNDGKWHHAVVEADREAKTLTVYLDGRKEATAAGIDGSVSLENDGDVHVGGTPAGNHLDGAIDFLRIAHGTLADADTTIEELYAWEFDGPFLRDFAGRRPTGKRRDAGAIEKSE